ncbi:MAG: DUF4870 domain-containing protein [Fimbriimonadales bacterium]
MNQPSVLSDEERLWGMLAHLLTLLGYVVVLGQYVAPLVVFLTFRNRSQFVAFHALQALYLQLAVLFLGILGGALACVFSVLTLGLGVLLVTPIAIAFTVVVLYYTLRPAIEASSGNWFEIPVVGPWARNSLGL